MSEWKTEVDEHLLDNFIYLITSNVLPLGGIDIIFIYGKGNGISEIK